MVYNGIPWDNIKNKELQQNTKKYDGILWNTMETLGIPWKPIQARDGMRLEARGWLLGGLGGGAPQHSGVWGAASRFLSLQFMSNGSSHSNCAQGARVCVEQPGRLVRWVSGRHDQSRELPTSFREVSQWVCRGFAEVSPGSPGSPGSRNLRGIFANLRAIFARFAYIRLRFVVDEMT